MRLPARLALAAGAVAGVLVLVLAVATGASRRAGSDIPPLTPTEKVLEISAENVLVTIGGSNPQDLLDLPTGQNVWVSEGGAVSIGGAKKTWIWVKDLVFDQERGAWRDDHLLVIKDDRGRVAQVLDVDSFYLPRDPGSLDGSVSVRKIGFDKGILDGRVAHIGDALKFTGKIIFVT